MESMAEVTCARSVGVSLYALHCREVFRTAKVVSIPGHADLTCLGTSAVAP